jgi:hypothetical protein
MNVMIDGIKAIALLDPGSDVSILAGRFAERLNRSIGFRNAPRVVLKMANSQPTFPDGDLVAQVAVPGTPIKGEIEFFVLSEVKHYDVLLGSDWLQSASIVAMFGAGNWYTLAGGELLSGDSPPGPEGVLHVDVCHIAQIGAEEERFQASVNA